MYCSLSYCLIFFFFFFNDTATTEIYTLSLHDALPIWAMYEARVRISDEERGARSEERDGAVTASSPLAARSSILIIGARGDRKSTRLNSSHSSISYAVFCLKKKKKSSKLHYNDTHTCH